MGLDIYFHRKRTREIGYFRKVNFLVKFFEERGFKREWRAVNVTLDDVEELLEACKQVLADHSKAEELLPTCDGFFFGSTDYDEWYFDDVKEVKEFCENELIPHLQTLDEDEEIEFCISY